MSWVCFVRRKGGKSAHYFHGRRWERCDWLTIWLTMLNYRSAWLSVDAPRSHPHPYTSVPSSNLVYIVCGWNIGRVFANCFDVNVVFIFEHLSCLRGSYHSRTFYNVSSRGKHSLGLAPMQWFFSISSGLISAFSGGFQRIKHCDHTLTPLLLIRHIGEIWAKNWHFESSIPIPNYITTAAVSV